MQVKRWSSAIACVLVLAGCSSRLGQEGLAAQEVAENAPLDAVTDVVASGVGTSADEALKDAFRNAVRQVVGAVVDADTTVKNDEIIQDQVLTYSAGFVKTYDEVPGSKKVQGGLHRIVIKARVERGAVVAKLTAAKVVSKAVDGRGLFAEVTTKLDAEKDAAALLKKQLADFPQSCLSATIVGRPEIVAKTEGRATLEVVVKVEADHAAYKDFAKRMRPILQKVARSKRSVGLLYRKDSRVLKGVPLLEPGISNHGRFEAVRFPDCVSTWLPKLVDEGNDWKPGSIAVALATIATQEADRIEYELYEFDEALHPIFADAASRCGNGKLDILAGEGDIVTSEHFRLYKVDEGSEGISGTLIAAFGSLSGWGNRSYTLDYSELRLSIREAHRDREHKDRRERSKLFFLSPAFCTDELKQTRTLTIPCRIELSLDELRTVKDAKVEIAFE